MPDQTREEWRFSKPAELGTLVAVTENDRTQSLLTLMRGFAEQNFIFEDEPITKFYFGAVPYVFVLQNSSLLDEFAFAWIPDFIRELFRGRCAGDDCEASKYCVRPGCICKKSIITGKYKCR